MKSAEPNLRELKARAQLLQPALRLGKAGLTDEFVQALSDVLTAKELVKIKFSDFKEQKKILAPEIAERTGSRLILRVGNTAVYYRSNTPKASAEA